MAVNNTPDYEALAQGMDEIREMLRVMVAGLVADGFTDREAREIIAAIWALRSNQRKEETDE